MRIAWVLDDAEELRAKHGFEALWAGFLRVSNVFQFLPKAMFLTSTGIAEHMYEFLTLSTSAESSTSDHSKDEAAWAEAKEFSRPDCLDFIDSLQKAGVPAPVMGHEIMKEGKVVGEAEMAWTDKLVAILAEGYFDLEDELREAKWNVFLLPSATESPGMVIQALK